MKLFSRTKSLAHKEKRFFSLLASGQKRNDEPPSFFDAGEKERQKILILRNVPHLRYLFAGTIFKIVYCCFFSLPKYLFIFRMHPSISKLRALRFADRNNVPVCIIEGGFLKSAVTSAGKAKLQYPKKYRYGVSFVIDDQGFYIDAHRPSRLETMLNDGQLHLTKEQKERAEKLIARIVKTRLTKYNNQPIITPQIGRPGTKKVLVVDQTYGDMSIERGLCCEQTFADMLHAAIEENPGADVIVKTHPDTTAGKRGYYTGLKEYGNVFTMTAAINPICLIQYVDKVYVCTTQLGLEALMCGKETHVFGMPFYAGWGLTHDRQTCPRRQTARTLEEVFYISYVMYSHYVNPRTKQRCEIEQAIEYLLELRQEFFERYKIRDEER